MRNSLDPGRKYRDELKLLKLNAWTSEAEFVESAAQQIDNGNKAVDAAIKILAGAYGRKELPRASNIFEKHVVEPVSDAASDFWENRLWTLTFKLESSDSPFPFLPPTNGLLTYSPSKRILELWLTVDASKEHDAVAKTWDRITDKCSSNSFEVGTCLSALSPIADRAAGNVMSCFLLRIPTQLPERFFSASELSKSIKSSASDTSLGAMPLGDIETESLIPIPISLKGFPLVDFGVTLGQVNQWISENRNPIEGGSVKTIGKSLIKVLDPKVVLIYGVDWNVNEAFKKLRFSLPFDLPDWIEPKRAGIANVKLPKKTSAQELARRLTARNL